MEIVRNFLNKAKHSDAKSQDKISQEEDYSEQDISRAQKMWYITVEEDELDNEPEIKVKKILKARKMSKKKKPVLTSKTFKVPDEVHQYVWL